MMQEKDVYKMFTNKKVRTVVAAICAAVTLVLNSAISFAAPYGFGNIDDVRNKALSNYLSANSVVAMVTSKAPANNNSSLDFTEEGELVTYETVTEAETVGFTTIKRLNTSLPAGETVTVREGIEGIKTVTYNVVYENGVEVSREAVQSVVLTNPVSKIVEYGIENAVEIDAGSGYEARDKASLDYKYYIDCQATAYDMSPEENGGYAGQSATGVPLEKGVIAVDPRVIPLGTRVYVEAIDGSWSYGYAVAADTGGAIKGNRVDLCYRTQYECIQFGRRPCRVYILN